MDTMQQVELLRAACCIVAADGEVTPNEQTAIDRLADRCGAGAASVRAMLDLAASDPKFVDRQLKLVGADGEKIIRMLCKIAMIDGKVAPEEREMLDRFADKAGVDRAVVVRSLGG
ncbi:MAG: hypothetical protein AAFR38_05320 [Planctomycetota bacterium]